MLGYTALVYYRASMSYSNGRSWDVRISIYIFIVIIQKSEYLTNQNPMLAAKLEWMCSKFQPGWTKAELEKDWATGTFQAVMDKPQGFEA